MVRESRPTAGRGDDAMEGAGPDPWAAAGPDELVSAAGPAEGLPDVRVQFCHSMNVIDVAICFSPK